MAHAIARIARGYMSRLCLLVLVAASLSPLAQAKDYEVGAFPAWVQPSKMPDRQSPPPSQVSQGVHYLLSDQQTRIDASGATYFRRAAVKALNERGVEAVAHIDIDVDPAYQTLVLHSIELYRSGKAQARLSTSTIRVLQRERDLEYRLYDGRKSINITLNDVRVDDVVEYAYSIRGTNPVFGNWQFGRYDLQRSVPIRQVHRRLIVPTGRAIAIHYRNTSLKPVVTEANGFRDYRWEQSDVEALTVSADSPPWFDPYPTIYWDEFPDWGAVANWAVPLYRVSGKPSVLLQNHIERIATSNADLKERVMAVLRFAQGDIRYLGVEIGPGSHAPSSPNTVLERRFGDCKDKSLLVVTMLQAMGIDARSALVNTVLRQGIKTLPPTPSAFNHVVVLVRLNGSDYWIDPTRARQDADFGNIVQADFSYALVVDSATTQLVSMNKSGTRRPPRAVNTFLDAHEGLEKPVHLVVTSVLEGEAAESMRVTLSTETRESLQKKYVNYYATYYPNISVTTPLSVNDELRLNRITLTEQYKIADFWRPGENTLRRVGTVFVPEVTTYLQKPAGALRTTPLGIAHPIDFVQTTEVRLPDKWPLKPERFSVDDPAFKYERTILVEGSQLSISDHFQSRADHVPLANIGTYGANVDRARAKLDYALFWNGPDPSVGPMDNFNWLVAMIGVLILLLWIACAKKLYRIDPRPKPEPVDKQLAGIRGWLILLAIGLCLTPIRMVFDFVNMLPSFANDSWTTLTTTGGVNFHAMWAPVLLFELAGNLAMIVFSTLLAVVFFQRRRLAPVLYLCVFGGGILFRLADLLLANLLPVDAQTAARADWPVLAGSTVAFAIWGSYFLVSKRAKATFVRGYAKEPVGHLDNIGGQARINS